MRKLMLLVGLLAVAACGSERGLGPGLTHIGAWELATVNFEDVPVVLVATPPAGCGVTVESGSLVIRDDMTYSLRVNYGPTPGCEAQYVVDGTYTFDGNHGLTLLAGNSAISMFYGGIAIDWDRGADTYTFKKP